MPAQASPRVRLRQAPRMLSRDHQYATRTENGFEPF
jgi:hypothetical protein